MNDHNLNIAGDELILRCIQNGSLFIEGVPPSWANWIHDVVLHSAAILDVGVLYIRRSLGPVELLHLLDKLNHGDLTYARRNFGPELLSVSGEPRLTQWLLLFEDLAGLLMNSRFEDIDTGLGQLCFGVSEQDDASAFFALAPIMGPDIPSSWQSMSFSDRSIRISLRSLFSATQLGLDQFWKLANRSPDDLTSIIRASSIWCTNKTECRERLHHLTLRPEASSQIEIDDKLFPFVEVKGGRSALVEKREVHRVKLRRISSIERSSTPVERAEWLAARIPPRCSVVWSDRYLPMVRPAILSVFLDRLLSLIKDDSKLTIVVGAHHQNNNWHAFSALARCVMSNNSEVAVRVMTNAAWGQLHERHLYLINTGQILLLPTADRLTGQIALDNFVEIDILSNRNHCDNVQSLVSSCPLI